MPKKLFKTKEQIYIYSLLILYGTYFNTLFCIVTESDNADGCDDELIHKLTF